MEYKCLTLHESKEDMPYFICCDENGTKINSKAFSSGEKYPGEYLLLLKKNKSKELPDLMLADPLMIPIVSQKLLYHLLKEKIEFGQYVKIKDEYFKDYYALNILSLVELIDYEKSSYTIVHGAKVFTDIYYKKIKTHKDFFRIVDNLTFPYVSERVLEILLSYDLRGVGFGNL